MSEWAYLIPPKNVSLLWRFVDESLISLGPGEIQRKEAKFTVLVGNREWMKRNFIEVGVISLFLSHYHVVVVFVLGAVAGSNPAQFLYEKFKNQRKYNLSIWILFIYLSRCSFSPLFWFYTLFF